MKVQKWKILLFTVGILIFSYMVYRIGLGEIWNNIKKTGWWFMPVIAVWFFVYLFNTIAFQKIICTKETPKEKHPSFGKILKVTISGYAINYITPFVSMGGEPYRVLEMQDDLGLRKAASSVLSYRMMHLLSHVVFWMCSIILILIIIRPSWGLSLGLILAFCVFVLVLYVLFLGYRKGLVTKTFLILGKLPILKKHIQKFNNEKLQSLQEIDKNIVTLLHDQKSAFYIALLLELLARIISCFEIFFIAKAIGMNISLLDSILIYSGSTLFTNILFFSPMQLGTREGGLALALNAMSLSAGLGIFMGLVMRIRELFWIATGLLLMRIKLPSEKQKSKSLKELTTITMHNLQEEVSKGSTHFFDVKGIIFDYGGTIDTNGIHWFEVFYKIYHDKNICIDKEILRQAYIFGEQQMEFNAHLVNPEHTFLDNLLQKINYQTNYLLQHGFVKEISDVEKDEIAYRCYDFARHTIHTQQPVLKKLAEKYPLVLVSNFYGNIQSVLKDFEINQYFQSVIESAVVGIRKPNPEIFRLGINALQLEPEQVAVVGDSYKNDIEPAQQLGCITVWLKNIGWKQDDDTIQSNSFIINKLEQLTLIEKSNCKKLTNR